MNIVARRCNRPVAKNLLSEGSSQRGEIQPMIVVLFSAPLEPQCHGRYLIKKESLRLLLQMWGLGLDLERSFAQSFIHEATSHLLVCKWGGQDVIA